MWLIAGNPNQGHTTIFASSWWAWQDFEDLMFADVSDRHVVPLASNMALNPS
jgi:hypothetical protein